ncbi:Prominin-1-A [Gryllus bimaculatus]|nr:Prominin-1-A [Gryllus bimaculatus]
MNRRGKRVEEETGKNCDTDERKDSGRTGGMERNEKNTLTLWVIRRDESQNEACEQNRPSYPAFRLHQVLDVDAATDHRRWEQLHRQLNRLEVNLTQLQLLTPGLQVQLSGLLNAALVNLTSHRSQVRSDPINASTGLGQRIYIGYLDAEQTLREALTGRGGCAQLSSPVTGKDLTSFADQLESVANQITDLATASRMETLASRTRRLLTSHLEPLKLRKEDLVYQITSLEVQLVPLQRQVNQSLSHLKTIQFFINNQGSNISHTKSREYAGRLVSYVQQYRDHVLRATGESVAPCRPIWDLFHAVRQLLCRHIMDPLRERTLPAEWARAPAQSAAGWCAERLLVRRHLVPAAAAVGGAAERQAGRELPAQPAPRPPAPRQRRESPGPANPAGADDVVHARVRANALLATPGFPRVRQLRHVPEKVLNAPPPPAD